MSRNTFTSEAIDKLVTLGLRRASLSRRVPGYGERHKQGEVADLKDEFAAHDDEAAAGKLRVGREAHVQHAPSTHECTLFNDERIILGKHTH